MSKHPRHWPSDAQARVRNVYLPIVNALTKTAPPLVLADPDHDNKQEPLVLTLHDYDTTEIGAANRVRCITLNFTLKGNARQFVKRLAKGKPLVVAHEGHDLLALLTKAAHETPENSERFQQGFLLGVFLREARAAGIEPKAGPCGVQLLARDCVFNQGIGKIECAPPQRQLPWTTYLGEHTHCAVRDLDAKSEDGTHQKVTCAVQLVPNSHREYGPGQHPVYVTHAGVTSRLMQHLDAGSMGLYNFIEYPDGSPHIRAPIEMINPDTRERIRQCPDSLVWFACQVLSEAYARKDLLRKLAEPSKGHTRRTELNRYLIASKHRSTFLPRSHLPRFDATKSVRNPTKDEENVDLIPVIPTDVNKAYKKYFDEVICRTRGIIDFTKGLRVMFKPLDPQAWITHLKKDEHVQLSVTLDIVYVYLPHWLDTDVGTKQPVVVSDIKIASLEDTEPNVVDVSTAVAEDEEDDDATLVMVSDEDDDDDDDAAIALTPVAKEASEAAVVADPSVAQS
jgi:hypothetical protein